MSNTSKEIEFLSRLDELTSSTEMILEFLTNEGLVTKDQRKAILSSSDKAKAVQLYLRTMKGKQLQLLEYIWEVLPVERLKATIVTDRATKEFSYNF